MADRSVSRSLWRVVFWVLFPFGILSFVLPIYSRELGASAMEVRALFTVMSLGPVVVRPFLGRALDRWGRRPFLILGLGAYVASMLLFTLARTVRTLTLARFIQGWGDAFLWLTAYTVAADLALEGQRGQEFGLMDEAYYRGAILGSLAGFGVLFAFRRAGCSLPETWPWLFALYILSSLVAFWFGWWGIPETRPRAFAPVESRPFSGQLLALMGIVFVTGASGMMVWPLLWLLESVGYCISLPAERAFVADIAGEDTRGTSYGLYTFAYFLGAAVGPLAGGWLYDAIGRVAPFYFNAGVLTLGALLVGLVLRESRPTGTESPASASTPVLAKENPPGEPGHSR